MSKVITPHLEELIDRFIASGHFNNKSEVIRAGLRLLEDREARATAASGDELQRVIQTALSDPRPLVPAATLLRRRPRQSRLSSRSDLFWDDEGFAVFA